MRKFSQRNHALLKTILFAVAAIGCFYASFVFAQEGQSLGSIAGNVRSSFANLAKLITAGAFLGGFGFAVLSILKFKAHKENAQSTPIGTPIVLMLVAIALLFLPSVLKMGGQTVFKTTTAGSISGVVSV